LLSTDATAPPGQRAGVTGLGADAVVTVAEVYPDRPTRHRIAAVGGGVGCSVVQPRALRKNAGSRSGCFLNTEFELAAADFLDERAPPHRACELRPPRPTHPVVDLSFERIKR
jgi:hypothetical protein